MSAERLDWPGQAVIRPMEKRTSLVYQGLARFSCEIGRSVEIRTRGLLVPNWQVCILQCFACVCCPLYIKVYRAIRAVNIRACWCGLACYRTKTVPTSYQTRPLCAPVARWPLQVYPDTISALKRRTGHLWANRGLLYLIAGFFASNTRSQSRGNPMQRMSMVSRYSSISAARAFMNVRSHCTGSGYRNFSTRI